MRSAPGELAAGGRRRTTWLALAGLHAVLCYGMLTGCSSVFNDNDPPQPVENVLLITVDTLRADHVGAYGYRPPITPNLDALAERGSLFEAAYAIYPKTGPSLVSLMTGAFPSRVHSWAMPGGARTLAEVLKRRGFRTVAAIDNGNLNRKAGFGRGFETYLQSWKRIEESEADRSRLITSTAIERLDGLDSAGRRFFMWLHYVNPHTPYEPPAGYVDWPAPDDHRSTEPEDPQVAVTAGLGDPGTLDNEASSLQASIARYDGEIAFTDSQIGEVLDHLQRVGMMSDTLVVITSDHGESLGEWGVFFKHGMSVSEANLRVPLILFHPEFVGEPVRVQTPVSLIDVMPTILEAVGIELGQFSGTPSAVPRFGSSLLPLIQRTPRVRHPRVFLVSDNGDWAVREGDHKLVKRNNVRRRRTFYLFDLRRDPDESTNLFAVDGDRAARLKTLLERRISLQKSMGRSVEHDFRDLDLDLSTLKNLRSLGYIE